MQSLSIDELVSNREAFNAFVYTPLEAAITEFKRRQQDDSLKERVTTLLRNDIPEPFLQHTKGTVPAIIFRQMFTPNYEIRRFVSIIDSLECEPIFFDHHYDKFVANSDWKYHLGRLCFYLGTNDNGTIRQKYQKIIDFNVYDGKQMQDVKTLWGQSLAEFHTEFFSRQYPSLIQHLYNASPWLNRHRTSRESYYEHFLTLCISHGILFENFLLDTKEGKFTKEIFLPAFISVLEATGEKPLIINLEPTDIEGDHFWMCHPPEDEVFVTSKMINL